MKIYQYSLVILLSILFTSGTAIATTISDNQFNPVDWSTTTLYSNNNTSYTVAQSNSGGNLDEFRNMSFTLPVFNPPSSSFIWVLHLYQGESYELSTRGAISSLNYSEDQIEFNPPFSGAAIGATPALEQDGVVYVGPSLNFTNTTWRTASLLNLNASDFVDFDSFSFAGGDNIFDNPDFSLNGGNIQFGYIRFNSTPASTVSVTTQHGIDNWSFTITSVPEPSTIILFTIGILGVSFWQRNKFV